MKKWNLYVLKYVYSGNYYVGTSPNLEKRMFIHWRRTSKKNNLPAWSADNKSRVGFKYYWFTIDTDGVSQADAEQCENDLADFINRKIEEKEPSRKTHVGNGKYIDRKEYNNDLVPKSECANNNMIDSEIEKILKTLEPFMLKNTHKIKCFKIGNVGEFQHNRNNCGKRCWWQVASVEFP